MKFKTTDKYSLYLKWKEDISVLEICHAKM
jgi:hypothetical protein